MNTQSHAIEPETEIVVTPHNIIVIEARPRLTPVPKARTWRGFIFGGLAIALGSLLGFLIVSPMVRAAWALLTGGLP